MRRILGPVVNALVVVCLLFFVAWLTVPRILGVHPQVVLTGSMEPTLHVGSVAFVRPAKAAEVKVGDVMTFHSPRPDHQGQLITHRVVRIVPDSAGNPSFVTKGDANTIDDNWVVSYASVVGTIGYSIPKVGYVTSKVQSPVGFLLIVGLPALYVAFGEIRTIRRELITDRATTPINANG